MSILPVIRMLLRGSLTPHCMDQYSRDDMSTAALRIHREKVKFWFEYDINTMEDYRVAEQMLKTIKAEYQTMNPDRLRKELLKWVAYEEHNLRWRCRGFKKINGEWTSRSQRANNLRKCLGR